jgi:hypothetical protein
VPTLRKSNSSRPQTNWALHLREVPYEGVLVHPNTKKGSSNTQEAESWRQLTSARNPSTTESQVRWVLSCIVWSTICFYQMQPHVFLHQQTEDGHVTITMCIQDVLPIILFLDKTKEINCQAICMTPTTYDVFACPHHFQKPGFSMKVQTWLPHNQLDVIVNKGHLGCGFIDQAFLLKTIGYSQPAQSVFAIQVKRF